MKFRYISLIGFVTILLSGCAKEQLLSVDNGEGNPIPINVCSTINQEATKATADGFVDGDAVGLFAVNYLEDNTVAGTLLSEGNQADNVKYVFDEKNYKWVSYKSTYYKDIDTHADLYLYYPYQTDIEDVNAAVFEVKKDQSAVATPSSLCGYEASDFLWGKGENISPSLSAVSIKLDHKMSAVKVTLTEGDGFDDGEFESLEKNIILTNTTRKANINYSTGSVIPVGEPQLDGIVMCHQSDGSWRAIAVPQTVKADVHLFAITINGISYSFKKPSTTEYFSGKQTNFTISVKKKEQSGEYELALTDTQITDWTEDRNTHGGEARQYFVVNVEEPGTLGETIKSMGKNPDKIRNLKVTGIVCDKDFYFMRDSMAILEAVNMKESQEIDGCIPENAFRYKSTLRHFNFPENITSIGSDAFRESKLSGALVFPDGVVSIGMLSFSETNIVSISFPSSLRDIGDMAFLYCSSLSGTLTLPSQLLRIERSAFCGCNFTGELHLPDNLEYIGEFAFYQAGHFVGNLNIPDKISTLFHNTFYGDKCFTGTLNLNNVTTLEDGVFEMCGFSGELIIPEGVSSIPASCFSNYDNEGRISNVQFPTTLKEIEGSAFAGQQRLTGDIILPEGLQIIEGSAFNNCRNITGIEFPSTIQTIQSGAFAYCYNISRIICNAIEPPAAMSGAFDGVAKDNFTLEVPEQSVEKYKLDPVWGEFKRISAHYDFSLSRKKLRALNAEITRTYTLRAPANFNWSIESKPDWLDVSPESGTGKTDVTITVHKMDRLSEFFEVNEGDYYYPDIKKYNGRSGKIVFKLDDKGYTFTMEIEQFDSDCADGDVITHQTATKGNGIDIIFVGEGYDAKDIANGVFTDNAEEGYKDFFNIEPYKTYKEYFNVYSVVSMSDESGIGTVNTIIDNKFGTYFSQSRIKLPVLEPIFSWAKKADTNVDFSKALVINLMNTSTYEGVTAMYFDGCAIAFCPVSRDTYPYDFRGIIQHEAGGHAFGKLGDEYIYHNAFIQNCGCDCCDHPKDDYSGEFGHFKSLGWYRNLSMNGDMHQVPWAHLIYHPQYSDYVDMFEGGYMHSRGMYRSEATSCMNNNIPYYSAISRQAIVERIMEIAGEEFTLEKFYAKDSNAFGEHTKSTGGISADRTFGVDPNWSRGREEGSVIYMGEHPDYSIIR